MATPEKEKSFLFDTDTPVKEKLANMMQTLVLQQQQQKISSKRLEQQFLQQHEILMQQSKLLETVLQKSADGNSSTISFTLNVTANSIGKFTYNRKEGITFASYFWRYEIFKRECKTWTDEEKLCLLLCKLSPAEHKKYCNCILPKKNKEHNFS